MIKVVRKETTWRQATFYGKDILDIKENRLDEIYLIEYFIEGTKVLHREDGPAHITYYPNTEINCEAYYINGRPHRTDGPAIIYYYKFDHKVIGYRLLGKIIKDHQFNTPGFIDAFIMENS